MLINLLPDFFAVFDSTDRLAAYQRYFAAHQKILEPYWHNYVIDPDSPHFVDIARSALAAERTDLTTMLERLQADATDPLCATRPSIRTTSTLAPARARLRAAERPAGPAPTTRTSHANSRVSAGGGSVPG